MRVTFVMEQHIGHQTYYQNLRHGVDQDGKVTATWAPITYENTSWILDQLPGISKSLRGSLQGMIQVRHALAHTNYDIAFFNTQVPAALAANQVSRRPYVLATDITPIQYDRMGHLYGHQPDKGGLLAAYKYRVNATLMQGAAHLLPWSQWARDSLIRDYKVNPELIDVVPPGVDIERWRPAPRQANHGPLRILFVGGDFYRKGGITLLEAFRALPRGYAELHIVTKSQIPHETGIYTYETMRPNSTELITLFQSSDVFVLPAEAEAFGIATIEASASGLAIIASAVGGLTDIVSDGETGFLIQPRDTGGLYASLSRLLDNPEQRARMGRAARQRAETFFNAQSNAARIIHHLRNIVDQAEATKDNNPSLSKKPRS
jgi:glycosyltransferase involved in cell wall biosynthesis